MKKEEKKKKPLFPDRTKPIYPGVSQEFFDAMVRLSKKRAAEIEYLRDR